MLEEPRPEDIGGHFWENASFLLVLLTVGIVVIFARAVTAADTGVAGVTWREKKRINSINEMQTVEMTNRATQSSRSTAHSFYDAITPSENAKWNKIEWRPVLRLKYYIMHSMREAGGSEKKKNFQRVERVMKNGGVGFDIGYHLSTGALWNPPLVPTPKKKGKREDSTRESVWDEKALSEVA